MRTIHIFIIVLSFLSANTLAARNTGQVLEVSFASTVATTVRPGTVQFSIQGGFSWANCNQEYAAIAKEDSHLISMLIAAKAQNKAIEVQLDSNSKYYSDRCLVSYLEMI